MAEIHDTIVDAMRRRFVRDGFKEARNPMPTYRPDVFAQKISKLGKTISEVVIEAEIESTIFSDHTAEQLVQLDDYLRFRYKKRIPVAGYLAVPKTARALANAKSLLDSLFPDGCDIVVVAVPVKG